MPTGGLLKRIKGALSVVGNLFPQGSLSFPPRPGLFLGWGGGSVATGEYFPELAPAPRATDPTWGRSLLVDGPYTNILLC